MHYAKERFVEVEAEILRIIEASFELSRRVKRFHLNSRHRQGCTALRWRLVAFDLDCLAILDGDPYAAFDFTASAVARANMLDFACLQRVVDASRDNRLIFLEKLYHLCLGKSDGVFLYLYWE